MFNIVQLSAFLSYITLFTAIAMLVTYSKNDSGGYDYDVFTVNLLTEGTKWILAFCILNTQHGWGDIRATMGIVLSQAEHGRWFAIPALVYFVGNAMTFLNLSLFDPTTVRVFSNMRVLSTGVLFQCFFNKRLGWKKWAALLLLTLGCFITRLNERMEIAGVIMLGSLLLQCLLSSLGGVSFEFLLKKGKTIDSIMIQNLYLYTATCGFNMLWILMARPRILFSFDQFFQGYSLAVCCIIIVGGCAGVGVSFLLKHLNVIYKEYANAVEMLTTALASAILFQYPVHFSTCAGILVVSISLYVYNKEDSPVIQVLPSNAKGNLQISTKDTVTS